MAHLVVGVAVVRQLGALIRVHAGTPILGQAVALVAGALHPAPPVLGDGLVTAVGAGRRLQLAPANVPVNGEQRLAAALPEAERLAHRLADGVGGAAGRAPVSSVVSAIAGRHRLQTADQRLDGQLAVQLRQPTHRPQQTEVAAQAAEGVAVPLQVAGVGGGEQLGEVAGVGVDAHAVAILQEGSAQQAVHRLLGHHLAGHPFAQLRLLPLQAAHLGGQLAGEVVT